VCFCGVVKKSARPGGGATAPCLHIMDLSAALLQV